MSESNPNEKFRGPIAWMARNSVASNLLMLLFLVGGVVAYGQVTKEFLPDTDYETVAVDVSYPGASPEEVEQGVILPVEEAVQGLANVGEIWAMAEPSRGRIRIRLVKGGNLQQLARDVQSRVDAIRSFPEQTEKPEVSIATRRRDVMSVVLYGDADRMSLLKLGESARDQLLQHPDVTQVDLLGLPPLHVNIEVATDDLRRLDLTIPEIAGMVRATSMDVAAGRVKTPTGQQLVRIDDRQDYAKGFAEIPLMTSQSGGVLRLGDVADVDDGFADTDRYATFNGKPALMLEIFRVGDETPVEVAEAVNSVMENIKAQLPAGISMQVIDSRAETYEQRVGLLMNNGIIGLLLVLLALGFFLDARLAFWVMMGIPISFLGAILLMPGIGVSINMVSLFAFIVALGIVVDDAIVVGENIYYHRERGKDWLDAAIIGAQEVAKPVTFSILTNIVAFMPLLFIPGPRGKLFWMIPAVVISAFVISLIESLFVLPSHLAEAGRKPKRFSFSAVERRRASLVAKFHHFVDHRYGPALDSVMTRNRLALAVAVSILIVAFGYVQSGRLGFQSFPSVESDYAYAFAQLPFGTPVETTAVLAERLIDEAEALRDEPGNEGLVEGIFADIGEDGSHTVEIRVFLADADLREEIMSTEEFVRKWRERVGEVAGVELMNFQADRGGPGGGKSMNLEMRHLHTPTLEKAAAMVAEKLREIPIVKDLDDGIQDGQVQYDVRLTEKGRALGMSAAELGRQLRGMLYGIESTRQLRSRNEVTILVRGAEEERSSEYAFESMLVKAPTGAWVPLREVATVERGRAYTNIERRNGSRVIDVEGDVVPRSRTNEVLETLSNDIMPEVRERYPGIVQGFSGRQRHDRDSMASLNTSFPVAMLAIFGLLAIPFRSYIIPLLIMSTIPFGFVGAAIGHIVMGYSLSIPSFLGVVALAGVLVNDSLVLVEFAERLRRKGMTAREAVRQAGLQRFRPIFLTSMTTFVGLMPMIFETSRQARFLVPMAISLGFGLLFATFIVLFLLPAIYVLAAEKGGLPSVDNAA